MSGNAYKLSVPANLDGLPFLGAAVYALEPPCMHVDGWTSHVIVANGGAYTSVFPCGEDGAIASWEPIGGVLPGSASHLQALLALGYAVVSYLPVEVPGV